MVATSGLPTWQNMTTGGSGSGGGGFSTGSDTIFTEDFLQAFSTNVAGGGGAGGAVFSSAVVTSTSGGAPVFTPGMGYFVNFDFGGGGTVGMCLAITNRPMNGSGTLTATTTAVNANGSILWGSGGNTPFSFFSTTHYSFQSRWIWNSSANGTVLHGMTTAPVTVSSSGTGIYLSFATTNNVFLNCVASSAGAVAGTINSGVTSTAWHTYLVTVTSSEVALTVDGALIGSITSTSQIPNTALSFVPAAVVNGGTSAGIIIDYLQIVSTKSVRP
jgi:hypothetical protein